MTTLLNVIRQTSTEPSNISGDVVSELASDINYIKRSSVLVSDALQKGSDIMQLASGDILITEVKTITYKYSWNSTKGRFERANAGHRVKRPRKNKKAA
jgi:hypothetical protein